VGEHEEPHTILKCYQQAGEVTMRQALEGRKQIAVLGS
jgi:hypothetical protein